MQLLSDGTVMVQGGNNEASKRWYQLKPNVSGSYVNGSWSQLASMNLQRLFAPAAVLPSGKVLIMGGEYSGPNTDSNFTNTGEIYDPVANSWTSITNFPQAQFGDDPIEVLPDGRVLAGYLSGPQTYIYDPASNSWSQTGTKLLGDASDEETWVKLPDGSILSYNVFSSSATAAHAQRYIPSTGTWVDAGILPSELSSDAVGSELGPAFLVPDGRAFFLGGNGATAFYTPSTNTWAAGPAIPGGFVAADAPGAMLPNGDVLFAASPLGTIGSDGAYTFPAPSKIFEFDPVAGTYTDVTPSDLVNTNSDFLIMLVLPTGQVMLTTETHQIEIYTPTGSPNDAWRPTITNITSDGTTYTLTGTQLNGISEGATFGDDDEMASNYPIVRLRNQAGTIFYARTFNWSSTGVATGSTPVSVQFTLPPGLLPGSYGVTVIANGIASTELQVNLGDFDVTNVTQFEGDAGFTNFVFTISQPASINTSTVAYTTADGSAQAGSDYVAQTGILTFAPGNTSQQVTVQVLGDTVVESDENFFLKLFDPQHPEIARGSGVGTILNDDVDLTVTDVSALQLTSGTTTAVFTISAVGTVPYNVVVNFGTVNDTAFAGVDYLPTSGIVTFAPGGGSVNVTVPILSRALYHSPETFFVQLTNSAVSAANPINGHLTKGVGVGTITNVNQPPEFYVNDVHVTAAQAGPANAVFTVALDKVSGDTTYVQYATADGTAQAGVNYSAESNTLTFAPGVTSMLVTVPVMTNGVYTPDEQFFLNLFNPVHAEITDPQGMATIIFGTPPPAERIVDDGDAAYGETNGWTNFTNTLAYQLDAEQHPAGDGSGFADWTFTGLPAGNYEVFAKWIPFSNRATNAPYTIYDGATPLATVRVNQQVMPSGDQSNGVVWQSLGTFNEFTGKLTVRLNDNANGMVVADAIRVVSGGIGSQAPQMDVSGSGQSIADSTVGPAAAATFGNGTDFGGVAAFSSSFINTFTITNTGNADLLLTGAPRVSISGANASDFTVVSQPPSTIAAGASATFQVMFHPGAVGERTAVLSIPDNDPTQAPYTFNIAGTGTAAGPSQLVVDDSGGGFQAAGGWATNANTLAYQGELRSDAAGQGADHATWAFSDLAPGNYTVYTTWVPFQNRATNAPFTIMDGGTSRGTVLVNEQQNPADVSYGGVMWKALSTLNVASGTLSVNLNNQANGYVIADAVYLVHNDLPSAVATTTNTGTAGAGTTSSSGNTSSTGTTSSTTNSVGGGSSLLGGTTIHNAANPLDVNGDGAVSALDALILIDHLLAPTPDTSTAYFMDVNGDGAISPADLLAVINFLHTPGPQSAVATSQAAAAADAAIGQLVATPAAATAAVSSAATVSSVATNSNAATNGALMQAAAITVAKKSTSSADSGSQVDPLAG